MLSSSRQFRVNANTVVVVVVVVNYFLFFHFMTSADNDAIPDTIDLWRHHHKQPNTIGCPMMPGETCVKYTYTYNKGGEFMPFYIYVCYACVYTQCNSVWVNF